MNRVVRIAALLAGALVLGATQAQAASVTSGSAGTARICTDAACTNQTLSLSGASGPVTGTFNIDIGALQLEFDLTLASAVLAGAADNGISSLTLQNLRVQGTAAISILAGADNNGTALPNIWVITGGTASVTGTAVPAGGSLPSAAIAGSAQIGGGCQQSATGVGVCGPIVNPVAFSLNGQTRYLTTTFNVAPEPAALSLLGLGLVGLAALRARCR